MDLSVTGHKRALQISDQEGADNHTMRLTVLLCIAHYTSALVVGVPASAAGRTTSPCMMPEMAGGMVFEHVSREWRCKWDGEDKSNSALKLSSIVNPCTDKCVNVQ